jgi:hypothetical protein
MSVKEIASIWDDELYIRRKYLHTIPVVEIRAYNGQTITVYGVNSMRNLRILLDQQIADSESHREKPTPCDLCGFYFNNMEDHKLLSHGIVPEGKKETK